MRIERCDATAAAAVAFFLDEFHLALGEKEVLEYCLRFL